MRLHCTLHDDFNHLFLLCKVERVCNETLIGNLRYLCNFVLVDGPCGPLENAPRAKFDLRARVCGPLG